MRTLILVDLQTDFLPNGALPVPEGDQVIPLANQLIPKFDLVVATQDWHPPDHASFAANHPGRKPGDMINLNGFPQVLWPTHCVQYSTGAAFARGLAAERIQHVVQKGTDPHIDSYSGFFDNGHQRATGLADYLTARNARDLWIMGLATDYCVKYTALDARQLNFNVTLIQDACRGVDLRKGDVLRAIEEMRTAGVKAVNSHNLP